jgi:hypothetical protein
MQQIRDGQSTDYTILPPNPSNRVSPVYRFYALVGDTKHCIQAGCKHTTRVNTSTNIAKHLKHKHPHAYKRLQQLKADRRIAVKQRAEAIIVQEQSKVLMMRERVLG